MDLTCKDVAELLNLPTEDIERLAKEGSLPAYLLGGHYRFSRVEVENWMITNKEESKGKIKKVAVPSDKAEKIISSQIGHYTFSLLRAIRKGGVINGIEGKTKEDVMKNAVYVIAKRLGLDADVLFDFLWDREQLMPTSLNHGIGVPHTRDFLLPKNYDIVTVVYPKEPIEYGALDGAPVHTLFFLFACEDKRHLHLLAKLAHLTREESVIAFLQSKPEENALLEFIKNWEGKIHHSLQQKMTIDQ
ncbi:MAG: PTS sugar transporter subunit IIA [Parachlamydiales bacterium]|nr:PTS sugar transporter subunit IIA [Parachlamydiales bacterium]